MIARVQLPDGRIARIEVPEGTTPEQALAFAQSQVGESTPSPSPPGIAELTGAGRAESLPRPDIGEIASSALRTGKGLARGVARDVGNLPRSLEQITRFLAQGFGPTTHISQEPTIPRAEELLPILAEQPGEEVGSALALPASLALGTAAARGASGAGRAVSALAPGGEGAGVGSALARFGQRVAPDLAADVAVGTAQTDDPVTGALAGLAGSVAVPGVAAATRGVARGGQKLAQTGLRGVAGLQSPAAREGFEKILPEILEEGVPASRQALASRLGGRTEKARQAVLRRERAISNAPNRPVDVSDVGDDLRAIEENAGTAVFRPEQQTTAGFKEGAPDLSSLSADEIEEVLRTRAGQAGPDPVTRRLDPAGARQAPFTAADTESTLATADSVFSGVTSAKQLRQSGKVEIATDARGQTAFRIRDDNGKTVAARIGGVDPADGVFALDQSATAEGLRGKGLGTDLLRAAAEEADRLGVRFKLPPEGQISADARQLFNRRLSEDTIEAMSTGGADPKLVLDDLASRRGPAFKPEAQEVRRGVRSALEEDLPEDQVRAVAEAIQKSGDARISPDTLAEVGKRLEGDPGLAGADISPDDLSRIIAASPERFGAELGEETVTKRVPTRTQPGAAGGREVEAFRRDLTERVQAEGTRQGVPPEEVGKLFQEADSDELLKLRNLLARSRGSASKLQESFGPASVQQIRRDLADVIEQRLTGAKSTGKSLSELEDSFLRFQLVLGEVNNALTKSASQSISSAIGGEAAAFGVLRGDLKTLLAAPALIRATATGLRSSRIPATMAKIGKSLADSVRSGRVENALDLLGRTSAAGVTESGTRE